MDFLTQYSDCGLDYELLGGDEIVELSGYVSAEQRIENLILAGKFLQSSREDQFDFPNFDEDEEFEDPTRSPNFDLVDAQAAFQFSVREYKEKLAKANNESDFDDYEENKSDIEPPSGA